MTDSGKGQVVGESVTILYRGARYEIGLVRRCYAVWAAGEHQSPPLEWWPETPEGWSGAWSRFSDLEPGGAIVQVDPAAPAAATAPAASTTPAASAAPGEPGGSGGQDWPGVEPGGLAGRAAAVTGRPGRSGVAGAAMLAAGVLCGFIGLFPGYVGGVSVASDSSNLVPHLLYLASWIIAAGLIMLGGTRMRAGALLALGTSAVTFGLFLADVGEGAATSSGAGLVLGVIGWAACTAGAVAAMRGRGAGQPGGVRGAELVTLVLALLAGLGVAAAFAPSWDSYTGQTATGLSQTLTLGDAFANPGLVIAGDVAVMIAVVAVAAAAALWRPVRLGAALLAGAIVPMLAQAISAMIGISQPASPGLFGMTPGQASQFGLTIGSSLTAAFWIYCVFLVALLLACALLLVSRDRPALAAAQPSMTQPLGPQPPGPQGPGGQGYGGQGSGGHGPGVQPVMPGMAPVPPVAPMSQPGPAGYAAFPAASPSGVAPAPGPAPGPAPAPGTMPTSAGSGGIPGPAGPVEPA